MSIDQVDFAHVTTQAQAGGLQSFWPILITTAGIALQTEFEVNINPCDAIWMPTIFDLSISKNPAQPPPNLPPGVLFPPPVYVPDSIIDLGGNEIPVVGANLCDVYQNGVLVQSAPVFSIRVNSPNNPWLLFGLSTQIGTAYASSNLPNLVAGQGGCMRSLTGPISRLWVKFYKFGTWETMTPQAVKQGVENVGLSAIVLMSSLGFQQQTIEQGRSWDATGVDSQSTLAWAQTISSGGYTTPQLNTADRKALGVIR
jgi:hypothetical protein